MAQIGLPSEVGPLMLSISKKSPHIEEAVQFIEFMNTSEAMEKIMAGEYDPKYDAYYPFRVPIRKDVEDSTFFMQYPEFYPFVMGFENPSINMPCSEWAHYQESIYTEKIHDAIIGNLTVDAALEGIR